jgi:hypothetical protein
MFAADKRRALRYEPKAALYGAKGHRKGSAIHFVVETSWVEEATPSPNTSTANPEIRKITPQSIELSDLECPDLLKRPSGTRVSKFCLLNEIHAQLQSQQPQKESIDQNLGPLFTTRPFVATSDLWSVYSYDAGVCACADELERCFDLSSHFASCSNSSHLIM